LAYSKTKVNEFRIFLHKNSLRLYELINGEIVEIDNSPLSGILIISIATEIKQYLRLNPIGYVGAFVHHYIQSESYNVRMPALSFRQITSDEIVKAGFVPTMPDLAIEIKSPSDTYTLMRDKAKYYLENGTRLVWLVYPEKKFIEVYRKDADIDFMTVDDTLSGYDVLPEFELAVSDIFP